MSFLARMTVPVSVTTLVENQSADRYGNPDTDPTVTEYMGWTEQVGSSEDDQNRETALSTWNVYLPAVALVSHTSMLEFNGVIAQVIGNPKSVFYRDGQRVHHVECVAREVEG